MDKSQDNYAERKCQRGGKEYILYDFIYIKF